MLYFSERRPHITDFAQFSKVNEGQAARFRCTSSGVPRVSCSNTSLYRTGELISTSDMVKKCIEKGREEMEVIFYVNNVTQGYYACYVTSAEGNDQSVMQSDVYSKPTFFNFSPKHVSPPIGEFHIRKTPTGVGHAIITLFLFIFAWLCACLDHIIIVFIETDYSLRNSISHQHPFLYVSTSYLDNIDRLYSNAHCYIAHPILQVVYYLCTQIYQHYLDDSLLL